jgi:Family of unknown function (DUF5677)
MAHLEHLRKLHDASVKLADGFTIKGLDAGQRARLVLYGRMVELAGSFAVLGEAKSWTGMEAIGRSFLEAYVDFQNVAEDDKYVLFLELKAVTVQQRRLKAAVENRENKYLDGVRELPDIDKVISDQQTRIEKLKELGAKDLTKKDAFERAGAADIYEAIYASLSDEAHNNIATLYSRGVENSTYQFSIYPPQTADDIFALIDSVLGLLAAAGAAVHEMVKSPKLGDMKALREKIEAARNGEIDKYLAQKAGR